jgi:Zn-dependent protease/CBS domain-containing protein
MFGRRFTLFRLLGFEVRIDVSWLFIVVLVTWSLAQGFFPRYYEGFSTYAYLWMGALGALGLFASIVFHELSHSLAARRFGLPMKGITLFIFGGVAEMDEEPASPKVEFFMAIAGPVASIIAGIIFLLAYAGAAQAAVPEPAVAVLHYLWLINFILAGFNLLPAFPLDGGRVLRSLLWSWKNNIRWATGIASQIGSGLGLALISTGVFFVIGGAVVAGIWYFLIGMFIRYASRTSNVRVFMRETLEGEPVSRFMKPDPVCAAPSIRIRQLVDEYIYRHHFKMYPVEEEGHLVGCITTRDVKSIPPDEWESRSVGEILSPCSEENSISADTDAVHALSLMHRTGNSRLVVVDGDRVVGIIALKDLLDFINLKMDLEGGWDASSG